MYGDESERIYQANMNRPREIGEYGLKLLSQALTHGISPRDFASTEQLAVLNGPDGSEKNKMLYQLLPTVREAMLDKIERRRQQLKQHVYDDKLAEIRRDMVLGDDEHDRRKEADADDAHGGFAYGRGVPRDQTGRKL